MDHLALFLTFVASAALLTITPGLDTVLVLRTAGLEGRRAAAMAASGIGLGCLIWGAAVSLGLGALLQASHMAYAAVKLAGAAYLLWLGIQLLIHPREALDMSGDFTPPRGQDSFRRGFLTNLLNPKMGVFYITFLPQFVPTGVSVAAYTFFLAAVHVVLAFVWFAMLIAATAPLSGLLRRPGAVPLLDRITGGLFLAFGLRLAFSSTR
ncbi:LysE family translocator [Novosphingobium sp. KACC 22771]|uniref:LysE family translocator n=1 Tax=Novosphingobium sp. KACC 22771 TaxID=3025670 RepID=UPI002365B446|nr:LysE family translocator [Novosphingobium sp. KACC 22771]WDF74742.1 LysE family translocator [Novosphingobium sp. KACC 22771]